MDNSLRFLILGQGRADRWPTLERALELLADVSDVVEREDEPGIEVALRTDPPQRVTFSSADRYEAHCTCGKGSSPRACAHGIAARLMWLRERGEFGDHEATLLEQRAAAMTALDGARAALVDTYLAQDSAGDEHAFDDLLCELTGAGEAMSVARAMVGRASAEQLSRFLFTTVQFHLGNDRVAPPPRLLGAATDLADHLCRPVDSDVPEANAPALQELYGRLRRTMKTEDAGLTPLPFFYRAVSGALGTLVRAGAINPRDLAREILADDIASPPQAFPVLGWAAPVLDPTGLILFRPMLEELTAMTDGDTEGQASTTGGLEAAELRSPNSRLCAEVAYAADAPDALAVALGAWPDAPYGEFAARASRRKSLTFRLAITEAAQRAGRLRWVDAPGRLLWSRGPWAEHLHMFGLPATYNPRVESIAISRVHEELPGHPAWTDVAIGDLVDLLADLDRREEARRALLDHAGRHSDPVHRAEFERIWTTVGLGDGLPEAIERHFGR